MSGEKGKTTEIKLPRRQLDGLMAGRNYYAYLVRIWRKDRNAAWQIFLFNPHSGVQLTFTSLDDLYAFISSELKDGG